MRVLDSQIFHIKKAKKRITGNNLPFPSDDFLPLFFLPDLKIQKFNKIRNETAFRQIIFKSLWSSEMNYFHKLYEPYIPTIGFLKALVKF